MKAGIEMFIFGKNTVREIRTGNCRTDDISTRYQHIGPQWWEWQFRNLAIFFYYFHTKGFTNDSIETCVDRFYKSTLSNGKIMFSELRIVGKKGLKRMAFAKKNRFIDRLALMKLMDLFVCKKKFI
jgi:hypothetical protein